MILLTRGAKLLLAPRSTCACRSRRPTGTALLVFALQALCIGKIYSPTDKLTQFRSTVLGKNDDIDSLAFELTPPKKPLEASRMKSWLTQYKVSSRSSTVTNAFVAALLPHDEYDAKVVQQAMADLGQKDEQLSCVYCGSPATTWDHLINLVQDRKANGHGHRVRNLVPCCSPCNSSKGGTPFDDWINGYEHPKKGRVEGTPRVRSDRGELVKLLSDYQEKCPPRSSNDIELEAKLMAMRDCVLTILKQADKLVAEARAPRTSKVSKPPKKSSDDA